MSTLDALNQRLAQALKFLGPEPANWVIHRDGIDHNVVIVGAGQSGLANAFALRRLGIGRVSVIDGAAPGDTGVWLKHARMNVLRTAKNVTGPELGIAELSYQAWDAAVYGPDHFAGLEFIAREDWARYVDWYQVAVAAPVRHGVRLTRIEPEIDHFRLHLEVDGHQRIETTRKIVLAHGVSGCGAANIPDEFAALPAEFVAHTTAPIDFSRLAGKTVAVIGSAASAFDAAAVALEAGAAAVHMFCRKPRLPSGGILGVRAHFGSQENFFSLPDELRWQVAVTATRSGATPPPNSVKRVLGNADFHLHLGAQWQGQAVVGDKVAVTVGGEEFAFDFVILGTGFRYDPRLDPLLAGFAEEIATWSDRYTPPEDLRHDGLGRHPYVGRGYQFLERRPGSAPWLADIHAFTKAATLSFGRPVGDIPSLKNGIQSVTSSIANDLFFADFAAHRERMLSPAAAPWAAGFYDQAVWRGVSQAAQ